MSCVEGRRARKYDLPPSWEEMQPPSGTTICINHITMHPSQGSNQPCHDPTRHDPTRHDPTRYDPTYPPSPYAP